MRTCIAFATVLVHLSPVRADQVMVSPAPVQPAVQVEPAFPVQFQDISVGYRHEELTDLRLNGFALRAVYGVPGLPIDGEGEMSGAWGYRADNLIGHGQISLGLRVVLNKPARIRPFFVGAPLLDFTRRSSNVDYALGANGGIGVDIILPKPGLVSIDVRGGRVWDIKGQDWSDWQLLATISIGAHVEP